MRENVNGEERKEEMNVENGSEDESEEIEMMIDEKRERWIEKKEEKKKERKWIDFLWRIKKIEWEKWGKRKGDVRRMWIGEKRRSIEKDKKGIEIEGEERLEIKERRKEMKIGEKKGNEGIVKGRVKKVKRIVESG